MTTPRHNPVPTISIISSTDHTNNNTSTNNSTNNNTSMIASTNNSSNSSNDNETTLKIPGPIAGGSNGLERYPCCVVATPLPCITWFLPFVMHMGICNSQGVIHDFAGPYYVSRDAMAFGVPTRYFSALPFIFPSDSYQIRTSDNGWEIKMTNPSAMPPAKRLAEFDKSISKVTGQYGKEMYNFFCNNCHSFTACVLEDDDKSSSWNMVYLATRMFFTGKFVSIGRFLWTMLPSIVIYGAIVAIKFSVFP